MGNKEILKAKAAALEAEARKLDAEATGAEYVAELSRIARDKALREEKEILAANKYHHVYPFNDVVHGNSVGNCINQLTIWSRNDPECAIEIIFNSPGGSVIDGMALYDYIQTLRRKGHHVTTVAMGYAASMAGILLQAGDHRVIGKESYVLIHEISTGAIGKIGEIEDVVEFCKKIQKRVINIFAARSNKTAAYFEKHWRRKDWWLSSEECEKIGIVDEVR